MENINVQIAQTVQPMLTVEIVQNLVPVMTAEVVIGGGQKITFGDTMTGAGTPTDPVNVSNDIITQITNNTEQAQTNASQIANIQSVIPESASAENQLTTREYVNNAILALPQYKIQVVSALPATGAEYILYLVPKAGDSNDIYDEYIWVPDTASFERIGTTAVDLSGYLPLTGAALLTKSGQDGAFICSVTNGNFRLANPDPQFRDSIYIDFYTRTPRIVPSGNGSWTIGSSTAHFKNIFSQNLNNGADLAVPSSAGTLARIEDIPQASALPEATADNVGAVMQYIGETDDSYTQGYFYKNTATTTDDTTTYAWTRIDVQPWLPDQADNAGALLTTDGTTPQWTGYVKVNEGHSSPVVLLDPARQQTTDYKTDMGFVAIAPMSNTGLLATSIQGHAPGVGAVAVGYGSRGTKTYSVAVGCLAYATQTDATAIGSQAAAKAVASIQLGKGANSDANTFKVGNDNGNFEMMDADGNIPQERLTYVTEQIGDISTALAAIIGE